MVETMLQRLTEALASCDCIAPAYVAKAVLEEMRNPTAAMTYAGDNAMDSDCTFECNGERAWRAMIDAALAE